MRYLLLTLLLIFPSLSSAQELHTFSNGEVADAEKINENFEALKSEISGSGGCSAEQDGSSVVITCADGTSGVLASEGTVVVVPQASVTPSPTAVFNTGEIYVVDANEVPLAHGANSLEYDDQGIVRLRGGLEGTDRYWDIFFINHRATESVYFHSNRQGTAGAPPKILFQNADCEGEGVVSGGYYRDRFFHYRGKYRGLGSDVSSTIFESYAFGSVWTGTEYDDSNWECTNQQVIDFGAHDRIYAAGSLS